MVPKYFPNLKPQSRETFNPGHPRYAAMNATYEQAKEKVEGMRDFFQSKDQEPKVDQNTAEGAVTLFGVNSEAGSHLSVSGELGSHQEFDYEVAQKGWGGDGEYGAARTDDNGQTTYFRAFAAGTADVEPQYTLITKDGRGTIFVEDGTL